MKCVSFCKISICMLIYKDVRICMMLYDEKSFKNVTNLNKTNLLLIKSNHHNFLQCSYHSSNPTSQEQLSNFYTKFVYPNNKDEISELDSLCRITT